MKTARFFMRREHAPPGFWHVREERTLVDGVVFESAVPTRFFQSADDYPRSWGRLVWRVQVNHIDENQAGLPLFRTFYPGVEWNLHHADFRWFLTAWYKWEKPEVPQEPRSACAPEIEGDTVLFPVAPADLSFQGAIYLRSRIDARERNRVAQDVRLQSEPAARDPGIIVLDDLLDLHEPT